MDRMNKLQKTKRPKKQNGSQITKLIITHPIFKPEAPDPARQFTLTFCKLHCLENKMAVKNKMATKSQN
jgi:hypothetical protein